MDKLEDLDLRSEEVQEILTRVPNWMIRWGSVLFLLLIIMVLGVSWFVKYPDIITAEALVTTEIPPEKEYAKISEKIEAILVTDNQEVIKHQPLAILESTANYKDVYKLKTIVDTISINSKSFHFPLDKLPLLFLGDIESQYAIFENNYIQYKINKDLKPFSNDALANKYSTAELNMRLLSLRSQKKISKTELDFKKKDLERSKTLYGKGVISTQDYENKQLEYAQAERNYKNFEV